MSDNGFGYCQHEDSVVAAVVSGLPMPAALADHLRGCGHCSAAHETAIQLNKLAALSIDDPLPSASFVMWKATLAARRSAGQKSRAILGWGEGLGLAAPVIAIAVLLGVLIANGSESSVVALTAGAGLTLAVTVAITGLIIWQLADPN